MIGAAILGAIFALAGAPASTPFTCQPDALLVNGAPAPNVVGVTRWTAPPSIEVRPVGCAALTYAAMSATERRQLRRLNPGVDLQALVGLGLLVDLREAMHVGTGSRDECAVERATMAKLPQLVAQVLPRADGPRAMGAAIAADGSFRAANGCG